MEFRLKNIDQQELVNIQSFTIDNSTETNLALKIQHAGRSYNTLFDDVLFLFNKVQRWLTDKDLKLILSAPQNTINSEGIALQCSFKQGHSLNAIKGEFCCYFYRDRNVYIREPEDTNNIVTIFKTKIEYISEVKLLKDIENCYICDSNKAIVSFSCCSINYCPQCAIKIVKTKSQCAQCRKDVDVDKIISLVK